MIILDLQEGRRNIAFDFCFQTLYPDVNEDAMRNCIYDYSRFNNLAEKIFGQYIREVAESKKNKKWNDI